MLFRNAGSMAQSQNREAAYLGGSSIAVLVWRYMPQVPEIIERFRAIDDSYNLHRGVVGGLEQNGLLVEQNNQDSRLDKQTLVSVSMVQARLAEELGAATVLTDLYETCRDRIIPYFPVISVSESLLANKAPISHIDKFASLDPNSTPPTPLPHIVRLIHCAIASRSRDVPEPIQKSILSNLHTLLEGPEMAKIASTRCLASIQVLLLLSMCNDINAETAMNASESAWQNVGLAIRMAFSIALHRNVSPKHIPYYQLNRRLRVWGACLCMDRWLALRLGRGFGIDLADCDASQPRHFADGVRSGDVTIRGEPIFPCFRFLAELTTLSTLLGKAYRLICTPLGLQSADDLSLYMLQVNIDTWLAQLPTEWPYSVKLTLREAPSLMNVFIIALEFTLQRTFLWPVTPIPAHLTFRPSPDRWQTLLKRAEQAVYWLGAEGSFYLDTWSNVLYPTFCCVIVFFKALEQSNDAHHRYMLDLADVVIQKWALQSPNDAHRSRMAAMSTLLTTNSTSGISADFDLDALLGLPHDEPEMSFVDQLNFGFDFDLFSG